MFEAKKRIAKSAGAAIVYVESVSEESFSFKPFFLDSCLTMAQASRMSGGLRTWSLWVSGRSRSTSFTMGTAI